MDIQLSWQSTPLIRVRSVVQIHQYPPKISKHSLWKTIVFFKGGGSIPSWIIQWKNICEIQQILVRYQLLCKVAVAKRVQKRFMCYPCQKKQPCYFSEREKSQRRIFVKLFFKTQETYDLNLSQKAHRYLGMCNHSKKVKKFPFRLTTGLQTSSKDGS